MTQSEFKEAMKRTEFRCQRCRYSWVSGNLRRPKNCSECASTSIEKVTGEGERRRTFLKPVYPLLRTLSCREREIAKLRYGIGDGYCFTHEQVASLFRTTPRGVRQTESRAIRKMRQLNETRKLKAVGLRSKYAQMTLRGPAELLRRIFEGL